MSAGDEKPGNPLARQFALFVLFALFATAGFSLPATVAGNLPLALQICGAGLAITTILLVVGAIFVARSRPPE
jgi:hypothetical protein